MKTNNIKDALYEVEQVPLIFKDDKTETPMFGLRRKDTGDFLSSCSSRYSITQNAELIDVAESCFKKNSLLQYTSKAIVQGGGARTYITYDFMDRSEAITPKRGDTVGLQITLINSFDKTLLRGLRVGMLRLICTNGMVGMVDDISIEDRHTTNNSDIDVVKFTHGVKTAVDNFSRVTELYKEMAQVKVSSDQADILFKAMIAKGVARGRLVEKVKTIWNKPSFEADEERTLYNFLNSWTQYLDSPHSDYNEKHYETSQKAQKAVFSFVRSQLN